MSALLQAGEPGPRGVQRASTEQIISRDADLSHTLGLVEYAG